MFEQTFKNLDEVLRKEAGLLGKTHEPILDPAHRDPSGSRRRKAAAASTTTPLIWIPPLVATRSLVLGNLARSLASLGTTPVGIGDAPTPIAPPQGRSPASFARWERFLPRRA